MVLHLSSTRYGSRYTLRPRKKNISHFVTVHEEVEESWAQQMIFAIGLRILALDSIPTAQWVIFLSASHTARGSVCKQFIPKQVCIGCGLLLVSCFYFSGILHMHPPWQPSAPELTHRQAASLPPLLLPGSYPWITVVTVHISASDHTGFLQSLKLRLGKVDTK